MPSSESKDSFDDMERIIGGAPLSEEPRMKGCQLSEDETKKSALVVVARVMDDGLGLGIVDCDDTDSSGSDDFDLAIKSAYEKHAATTTSRPYSASRPVSASRSRPGSAESMSSSIGGGAVAMPGHVISGNVGRSMRRPVSAGPSRRSEYMPSAKSREDDLNVCPSQLYLFLHHFTSSLALQLKCDECVPADIVILESSEPGGLAYVETVRSPRGLIP